MRSPLLPASLAASVGLSALLLTGCTERASDALTGRGARPSLAVSQAPAIRAALAAQGRHTPALMRIPGVVGTAVGLLPDGRVGVKVLLADGGVRGVPAAVDGVPVATLVTGMFMARSDPTTRQRPAPMGFSVGAAAITTNRIGAR